MWGIADPAPSASADYSGQEFLIGFEKGSSAPDGPDRVGTLGQRSSLGIEPPIIGCLPSPLFFVSVASKGLNVRVSGLESTFADTSVSVDSKGG